MSNRNWNSREYKKWRLSIYRRDKFICKWPNCRSRKRLNAHHIMEWSTYPLLRFNIKNGITLCAKHHRLITGNETYYADFLAKLLDRKKRK